MITQRSVKSKSPFTQNIHGKLSGIQRRTSLRLRVVAIRRLLTSQFMINTLLLIVTIYITSLSIRKARMVVLVPMRKHTSEFSHGLESQNFLITADNRTKYRELLQIFSNEIGYKGILFQDSIDTIQQSIELDSISYTDMDKVPVFQAFVWLAEESFSNSYIQAHSIDSKPLHRINLMQRFALAVLYFSTKGDMYWKACSRSSPTSSVDFLKSESNIQFSPCVDASTGKASRFLSHEEDECRWYGITCNNSKQTPQRIRMIDLTQNGLIGTIPLELVLLSSSLELLWMPDNYGLSGTIPEWIHHMKGLTSINLQKTNIGGEICSEFYTLERLESIRLNGCKFKGTISSNIDKMPNLKWFWIHENKFEGRIPDSIRNMKRLEGLSLYGNNFIRDDEMENICKLRDENLEHLWVDCDNAKKCKCCSKCFPRSIPLK